MKNVLRNVWRIIVGTEFGWGGEGNKQWYYFLALVMNCMLTWWLKPELGIVFTLASIIHYITVCIYGYTALSWDNVEASIIYFGIHFVLFVICVLSNCLWTFLTMLIVIIGYFLAPDEMGNNFFMPAPKFDSSIEFHVYHGNENNVGMLICHTVWFIIFTSIAFNLQIALWIKASIVIACMILHPIIDLYEGDGMSILQVTEDAFDNICEIINKNKEK